MTPWLELVGGRNPHRGAQALWRSAVHPQSVPGYSTTRWYAGAEIQFVLAENCHRLPSFLAKLDEYKYGDATRQKLHNVIDSTEKFNTFKLQLAAMLDMRQLVQTTYELEGDQLEFLLVYQRVERLRALGNALRNGGASVLPNLDAALQAQISLRNRVKIGNYFEGHGVCEAQIIASRSADSTLYPGQKRKVFRVRYSMDKNEQEFEEEEIRQLLLVTSLPERQAVLDCLIPAFDYLESRITGTCAVEQYSCEHMYTVCRLSRIFDPNYAAECLTTELVDEAMAEIKPLGEHINVQQLKMQLPVYLVRASEAKQCNQNDVQQYSEQILHFWKSTPEADMSEWRKAARIVFTMSPNSASCERVFSLLDAMYGAQRENTLADHIQASLMLRYNSKHA